MRRVILTVFLTSLLVSGKVQAELNIKGIALPGWGAEKLSSFQTEDAIIDMANLGTNFVNVSTFWFTPNLQSNEIGANTSLYSPTNSSLQHALAQINDQNMSSGLQLFLDVENGDWRGNLDPTNPNSWFTSYENYLVDMATLAEEENVDTLTIGTNLYTMEGYDSNWRSAIQAARNVYNGKLTYATNFDSLRKLSWVDALDVVTIDAYPTLSHNDSPSSSELTSSWQSYVGAIEAWTDSNSIDQPVRLDGGLRSVKNAASAPWDSWTQDLVDVQVQKRGLEAMLSVTENSSVIDGVSLWHWDPEPSANGPTNTGFTFKDKPAESVVRKFFGGQNDQTMAQPGDSDLNGSFDQFDLVKVLQAGKYLSGKPATWGDGDWNGGPGGTLTTPPTGNYLFDQKDIIAALGTGLYNQGPYAAQVATVPEPTAGLLLLLGLLIILFSNKKPNLS